MGSPKALLEFRGETFLSRLVRLMSARCAPVIVVLGAAAEADPRAPRPASPSGIPITAPARPVPCNAACARCPAVWRAFCLRWWTIRRLLRETIDALLRGRNSAIPEGRGAPVAPGQAGTPTPLLRVPRYQARRGHPIWFSAAVIAEFLALPATGAARDVVRAHAAETDFLDVDDPGILADIDDAAAYRALTGGGQ